MTDDALDETVAGKPTTRDRNVLAAGAQLGKYTLERVLGAGGMGVVWAAHDPDLERSVAIKLLLAPNALPEQRARLLREARAMARLKHPNVLTVYEVDTDGDRDFIAMELVEGASLDAWLAVKPPAAEVWEAVVAAGRGLAAAHAAGLVHRDFKPHNVLRSRDGRVLVTDFGLARGMGDGEQPTAAGDGGPVAKPAGEDARRKVDGEPVAGEPDARGNSDGNPSADRHVPVALDLTLAASSKPAKSKSGVDSTLTQPGAFLGTPAYMAPEQYYGVTPDPRTDQFAFCVAAWEALTGERPFKGENLEELRKASSAGVADVQAKLPRAIRAVLARGLAVDPAARWPDLDTLLDRLERARDLPRRRRAAAFITLGLVAAVVMFVAARQRGLSMPAANPNGCEAPEHAFDAWTKDRRAAFEKRLGNHPNAVALGAALDTFRDAWLRHYHDACAAAPGPKVTARINCLLGERDDLDGLARMCDTLPTSAIAGLELWGLVPALEACEGDSPVAPPLLPEDHKLRDQIVALRSQVAALRVDPGRLLLREDELVGYAKHLGWRPLVPEIEVAVGTAAQLMSDLDKAHTRFESAADEAVRLADFRVEATARIGLLEVEMTATPDPSDAGRATKLFDQATDAVQRAGADPALASSVDELRAQYDLARGDLKAAIDRFEVGRTKLLASRALRAAAVATTQEIEALLRRGQPSDIELAWKIGLETEAAIAASNRPSPHRLDELLIDVAWQRGDLDQVHARADKLPHTTPPTEERILAGVVIGPDGTAISGARVVAWNGALEGDASRIYTKLDFMGEKTTTDATGAFSFMAPKTGAVIAEHEGLRSEPFQYEVGAITLKLAATRTLAGRVDTPDANGLDAFVRGTAKHTFVVRAPVGRDKTYVLAGVPAGVTEIGLEGTGSRRAVKDVWVNRPRDAMTLAWTDGPTLDVIARGGDHRNQIQIVVLRGRAVPKTEAEVFTRAERESDVPIYVAEPIGFASATREGQPKYARGDLHAVIVDNAPGDATVCAVWDGGNGKPSCAVTPIAAGAPTIVVTLAR